MSRPKTPVEDRCDVEEFKRLWAQEEPRLSAFEIGSRLGGLSRQQVLRIRALLGLPARRRTPEEMEAAEPPSVFVARPLPPGAPTLPPLPSLQVPLYRCRLLDGER